MESAGYKWLLEHYPMMFGALLLIFITYKFCKFYFVRFRKVEEECDKISALQTTARLNGEVSARIERNLDDKLFPKIDSIVTSINGLLLFLNTKHKDFKSELFVVKSPVELSPIGNEILEVSGGKKYIDTNSKILIALMEKNSLKSALDVQNHAHLVLLNQFDSDQFTEIKNYLYNNPIYRKEGKDISALNITVISQIMAIYLRNKYFEIHPELRDIEDPHQSKPTN
jgi:hypothetical protein